MMVIEMLHARSYNSSFYDRDMPMCGTSSFIDDEDIVSINKFAFSNDKKCWECESLIGVRKEDNNA
jgi:hypothetical protein